MSFARSKDTSALKMMRVHYRTTDMPTIPPQPDPLIEARYLKDVEDNPIAENIHVIRRKDLLITNQKQIDIIPNQDDILATDVESIADESFANDSSVNNTIAQTTSIYRPLLMITDVPRICPAPKEVNTAPAPKEVNQPMSWLESGDDIHVTEKSYEDDVDVLYDHVIEVTFVRHGQSEANLMNICQGYVGDSKLSYIGTQQAIECGKCLCNTKFDQVYTSDSERAHSTCQNILAMNHNTTVAPQLQEILRERKLHNDGKDYKTIYSEAIKRRRSKVLLSEVLLEDDSMFTLRQEQFLRLLYSNTIKQEPDQDMVVPPQILVSTHGGYIQHFLKTFCEYPDEETLTTMANRATFRIANSSVHVVRIRWDSTKSIISYQYRYMKNCRQNCKSPSHVTMNTKGWYDIACRNITQSTWHDNLRTSSVFRRLTRPVVQYYHLDPTYNHDHLIRPFLSQCHFYVAWDSSTNDPINCMIYTLLQAIDHYIRNQADINSHTLIHNYTDSSVILAHKSSLQALIKSYNDKQCSLSDMQHQFMLTLTKATEDNTEAYSHSIISVSYLLLELFEISSIAAEAYLGLKHNIYDEPHDEEDESIMAPIRLFQLLTVAIEILAVAGYIVPHTLSTLNALSRYSVFLNTIVPLKKTKNKKKQTKKNNKKQKNELKTPHKSITNKSTDDANSIMKHIRKDKSFTEDPSIALRELNSLVKWIETSTTIDNTSNTSTMPIIPTSTSVLVQPTINSGSNVLHKEQEDDFGLKRLYKLSKSKPKMKTMKTVALGVGMSGHVCNSIYIQSSHTDDMQQHFLEPQPALESLVYIVVQVSPATLNDYSNQDPMQIDPNYVVTSDTPSVTMQTDGGAIVSVIDYKTASHIGGTLLKRTEPLYLTSASKDVLPSHYYLPVRVTVQGINAQNVLVERTAIVIFNVIPKLSTGILLGADSMRLLGVINDYNSEQTINMFKDDPLKVSYVTQKRVQESNASTSRLAINSLKHQTTTTYTERYNKVFSDPADSTVYQIPDSKMMEILVESQYARSNPDTYMNGISTGRIQGSIAQVMAIYELHELYDITFLSERLHRSADGTLFFDYVNQPQNSVLQEVETLFDSSVNSITATTDGSTNGFTATKSSVEDSSVENSQFEEETILDIIDVYKNALHQMIRSSLPIHTVSAVEHHLTKETVDIMEDVTTCSTSLPDAEEILTTQQQIADIIKVYCTQELEELRPALFPKELWRYVFDKQKALTKEAWHIFIQEATPGRIEEVIAQILNIDISKENASRSLEEPLFMAQCLANIGRYAHPDLTNPPRAKGREYEINLTDDTPCDARMRRYSQVESAFLHHRIKQLVGRQMVGLSKSSYNNPPLCVPNIAAITSFMSKHGMQAMQNIWKDEYAADVLKFYRLVNDFRDLNSKTKLERWPLPYIMDLINRMKGSDRYSTGDIEDAFFTVNMKPEHRARTAFSTPHGHYEYLCMGQGLKNAANFFAKLVHEMFSSLVLQGVPMSVYQDDVCNFANELLHHLQVQQQIYDIMAENHLVFKPAKSHLNYLSQRILGHILSKRGRAPDPKLIETITSLATPKTLEGLRSLLGLAQVAREYIHELSTILQPIQELTRKGVDVPNSWSLSQDNAFKKLKDVLTSAPVLGLPDINKPFRVHVDACRIGKGIGAILLQQDQDLMDQANKSYTGIIPFQEYSKELFWHPVAYWSRVISKEERKYPATELECTALHDSILHWKIYLQCGCPFEAITDHYALVYMVTKMSPTTAGNNRLTKLCIELQGYTFGVTHRSGKLHIDADAVSRLLSIDTEYQIFTADQLRDDNVPPTNAELGLIDWDQWKIEDQLQIQEIIKQHQRELYESYSTGSNTISEFPAIDCPVTTRPLDMNPVDLCMPINNINMSSKINVYRCSKCTNKIPDNEIHNEYDYHQLLQRLCKDQHMLPKDFYCEQCIGRADIHSTELLCTSCICDEYTTCLCSSYQAYCLMENEPIIPLESDHMDNFCLSVIYYIEHLRIHVNNMAVCYNLPYPSIRTCTDYKLYDDTSITFQHWETGYNVYQQYCGNTNVNDCSNRVLLLYELYLGYHDMIHCSHDIDCSSSCPYTEEQLDQYIQSGDCEELQIIMNSLRSISNPIYVLQAVSHVLHIGKCTLAMTTGNPKVQQIVWIRQLYSILNSIHIDGKQYTNLFTDMLECILPTFINNRWVTLVGLKVTTQATIPDLVSDSDSDSEDEDNDYVINSVNSIITSSTCRFNSRHRHSIEGYRNIQYHMESSKYAINTLRTEVNKSKKANVTFLVQQAQQDLDNAHHLRKLRETTLQRHREITKASDRKYKKRYRQQKIKEVNKQAIEIIADIATSMAENSGVQVDYNRQSSINSTEVIVPVVITDPQIANVAIEQGIVYIDQQCNITSTELQEAYIKLNIDEKEIQEAAAVIQQIPIRQRKKRVSTLVTVKKNQPKPTVNRELQSQLKAGRIKELEREELTKYDYLVQKHYMDTATNMLMIIINTYIDKDSRLFMATAHPFDIEIQADTEILSVHIPIHGDSGVLRLVDKFETANNKKGMSWPVTQEDWLREQLIDPYWQQIIEKLQSEDKVICLSQQPDVYDYLQRNLLSDGTLGPLIRIIRQKKQVKNPSRIIEYYEEFTQMVVPKHLVYTCMELIHDGAGHPGRDRNLSVLKYNYYWETMNNDCAQYIHDCTYCRNRKISHDRGYIPLQSYLTTTRPNERVHMDCLTGLPVSNKYGFIGILIIKDSLTKWVELIPLRAISAQAIAEGLITNYISRWGVPEQIVSDNGPEFANVIMLTDILKILAAKNMHITARNPQANGLAENQVKTVKDMLASYIAADQRNWEDFYPICQMFINSTISQSTQFTPYMMMTGREMNQPSVPHLKQQLQAYPVETGEVYVRKLIESMLLMWDFVSANIEGKNDEINNSRNNKTHSNNNNNQSSNNNNRMLDIKSFHVNEYVFIRNMPRRFYKDKEENVKYHINFKLQAHRFVGPYRIKAKLSPVIYTLDIHGEDVNMHIIHMKSAGKTSLKQRKAELNQKHYKLKKIGITVGGGNQNPMKDFQNEIKTNLETIQEDIKYYANDNVIVLHNDP